MANTLYYSYPDIIACKYRYHSRTFEVTFKGNYGLRTVWFFLDEFHWLVKGKHPGTEEFEAIKDQMIFQEVKGNPGLYIQVDTP